MKFDQQQVHSTVEALQQHLSSASMVDGFKAPVEAITCLDGSEFSVQAAAYIYCTPRSDYGPWTHVEVMNLSDVEPTFWEEDEYNIGAYVPIEDVAKEILLRGGDSSRKPESRSLKGS